MNWLDIALGVFVGLTLPVFIVIAWQEDKLFHLYQYAGWVMKDIQEIRKKVTGDK